MRIKMNSATELNAPKSVDVARSKWSQMVDEAIQNAREKVSTAESGNEDALPPPPPPKEAQPA
jgi:vacuolar-type H+-ATPase subunit H